MRIARRAGEPFLRDRGRDRERTARPPAAPARAARRGDATRRSPARRSSWSSARSCREGSELEAASPTWPARGVVLAGGTAVLHEGVFEYEVVGGGALAVTLLRCVGTISRTVLATRPFEAGPDVPTPLAQMLGETTFSLGVWPGADARTSSRTGNGSRCRSPRATAAGVGSLPPSGTLLELSGDGRALERPHEGRPRSRFACGTRASMRACARRSRDARSRWDPRGSRRCGSDRPDQDGRPRSDDTMASSASRSAS